MCVEALGQALAKPYFDADPDANESIATLWGPNAPAWSTLSRFRLGKALRMSSAMKAAPGCRPPAATVQNPSVWLGPLRPAPSSTLSTFSEATGSFAMASSYPPLLNEDH